MYKRQVKRLRVPVIAEELSDMAAVRLELNQLCDHVEKLSKQLSSIHNCHCRSKMQSNDVAHLQGVANTSYDDMEAAGQASSVSRVKEVCTNAN